MGDIVLEAGLGTVSRQLNYPAGMSASGTKVRLTGPQIFETAVLDGSSYGFINVPVVHILTAEQEGLAADVCGSTITIGWHGHNLSEQNFAMTETAVTLDPVAVQVRYGQWYTTNSSITVNAVAPFADDVRYWLNGNVTAYVPFDDSFTVSGLEDGDNTYKFSLEIAVALKPLLLKKW